MERDRSRRYAVAACAVLAMGIGPWVGAAEAQYFGRNKVQYESFDFQVLKTDHFDIHYYPEEREAVEQAARMAERWYARLSRLFNHELSGRQTIILYADHPDFEQTTALPGQIDEGTGGVTEAFKRRVVLPMAGSLAETDHVLGHELVHAFQFDITTRTRAALGGQFPGVLAMPLWVAEGMAEYLSLGPVYPLTAMWMRDAARREELPSFQQLANPFYNPYRYGHALWAYIGGRWGDPAVGEILKAAAATGDLGTAVANVLEISPDQLMNDWEESILAAYQSLLEKTRGPEEYGRALISPDLGSGNLNIAPALSPDGSQVVFLSEKDRLSIEMFRADAETGEIKRKILKTALDPHFESLQFINSAGAWHPDGREFVFAGISKGKPVVTIIDTERGKAVKEFKVPQVGEIFNPSWSPDGRYIAFSASVGGLMEIFILDTETTQVRRLTDDAYADLQPAWSPDGHRIAFVTDRFGGDLSRLRMGNYRLALIDPESGAIEPVPGFPDGKNINPQWSGDGSGLYFLSDVNGITNIYLVTLESGELRQVTNLPVGVSGITALSPAMSVAANGERLVFSAYEGDRYTLYVVDDDAVLAGGPVEPPLAEVSPAILPPADRPVGDVMALMENAELGLPDTADEFETVDYSAGLSLDYIAPPTVAVGTDRFGTFVGGGTALFWSDILGQHTLATLLQVNGSFQDVAALVGYQSRKSRWNWGLAGSQIPILTGGFLVGRDANGNVVEQELRLRQISREISGFVAYPMSRVQRVEFSGRYRNITFNNEVETRTFSRVDFRQIDSETVGFPSCSDAPDVAFCEPSALNLGTAGAALVYDNALFGFTGPVIGQRYRLEVSPTFGSLNYVGTLVDYRRYLMPVRPYTLAGRIVHFARYAGSGEDDRLLPLFIGYQPLIRGYNSGSFGADECGDNVGSDSFVGEAASSCPVFDQLLGSRMLVGNFELRVPAFRAFGLRRPVGFPPLELAAFFDAGVAWWSAGRARSVGGNRNPLNPVTSFGAAARINLFGAALLEIDYVHPNDRPRKGWYWQFGLTPGF